ncbi:hypothetical protein MMAD_55550 (plasmid) [Mycolicibacterium madagascariense]|uniref:Uncharacterized protein n=1 Tax=Mycolicibacterium madagascariense TaxID=212765 RepID=A0A7I7XPX4_9MYCO|nr:hypothetical protein [Mycolicibacterium madagascariense]BBZ31260.1 hypothetical protein MMAD_55550 [Mycolicibacterium madagascariense]
MNRADENVLAWSLLDEATDLLTRTARAAVCVMIGAGDEVDAIHGLLRLLADHGVELPTQHRALVWDWVWGYFGSDDEDALAALLTRLGVPEMRRPVVIAPSVVPPSGIYDRRPKRVHDKYPVSKRAFSGSKQVKSFHDDMRNERVS